MKSLLACIRENAANQSRKHKALAFWGNKALAEALTAWRAFAEDRQQLRGMVQQAAGFWMQCSLRSAFYAWLDGAARSQETKLALRKAAGFFTNRSDLLLELFCCYNCSCRRCCYHSGSTSST